jgi:hypothetical protein
MAVAADICLWPDGSDTLYLVEGSCTTASTLGKQQLLEKKGAASQPPLALDYFDAAPGTSGKEQRNAE